MVLMFRLRDFRYIGGLPRPALGAPGRATTCVAACARPSAKSVPAQRLEFRHSRGRAAGSQPPRAAGGRVAERPPRPDHLGLGSQDFGRPRLARGQGDRVLGGTPRTYREGQSWRLIASARSQDRDMTRRRARRNSRRARLLVRDLRAIVGADAHSPRPTCGLQPIVTSIPSGGAPGGWMKRVKLLAPFCDTTVPKNGSSARCP